MAVMIAATAAGQGGPLPLTCPVSAHALLRVHASITETRESDQAVVRVPGGGGAN